jgi:hypothetical protein
MNFDIFRKQRATAGALPLAEARETFISVLVVSHPIGGKEKR